MENILNLILPIILITLIVTPIWFCLVYIRKTTKTNVKIDKLYGKFKKYKKTTENRLCKITSRKNKNMSGEFREIFIDICENFSEITQLQKYISFFDKNKHYISIFDKSNIMVFSYDDKFISSDTHYVDLKYYISDSVEIRWAPIGCADVSSKICSNVDELYKLNKPRNIVVINGMIYYKFNEKIYVSNL